MWLKAVDKYGGIRYMELKVNTSHRLPCQIVALQNPLHGVERQQVWQCGGERGEAVESVTWS